MAYVRAIYCGSIPAYAGDPENALPFDVICGVYPRLRGGSYLRDRFAGECHGLSPPTRGIPGERCARRSQYRSIPAYAGDPTASKSRILTI